MITKHIANGGILSSQIEDKILKELYEEHPVKNEQIHEVSMQDLQDLWDNYCCVPQEDKLDKIISLLEEILQHQHQQENK